MAVENFHLFAEAVERQFRAMASTGELYTTDPIDIFETYLGAFPPGSNPIFRERTEHDCSCCKNFIRNIGHLVAIDGDRIETVWDIDGLPEPYDTVTKILGGLVRQLPIKSVYRTSESRYGNQQTIERLDNGGSITWKHFYCSVPRTNRSPTPDKVRGEINTTVSVFQRALNEISVSTVDTVLELIAENAIYRGEEHSQALQNFRTLLVGYDAQTDIVSRSVYAWKNFNKPGARIRNSVIGSLLVDIAAGDDLEKAVRSFESKVAPQNYKRPKAVVTQRMVDDAMKTIAELGLEPSIERRFAVIEDVSVNNVLFVDNAVRSKMKQGGLAGLLSASVKREPVSVKYAYPVAIETFLSEILPNAQAIDLLVENKHQGNFMSLTAPVHADAPSLFRWNNGFAWSYDGEVTDSIRERVKLAGGNVDGAFRVSLSWNNTDDLDLHVRDKKYGHVYFGDKGHGRKNAVLDVDIINPQPNSHPVENYTWQDTPLDGEYRVSVNSYTQRSNSDVGYTVEIELSGETHTFNKVSGIRGDRTDEIAVVTVRGGKIQSMQVGSNLMTGSTSKEKWGIQTETLVPVDTLMASPNHWDDNKSGNKHWFFILNDAKNPNPVRGVYNEFLGPDLEKHRKVFEMIGSKTKCEPTDNQLSGLGFSSTRSDEATVVVTSQAGGRRQAYRIQF